MNAYMFNAALLCEACAKRIRAEIEAETGASAQLLETGTDSESYPQGPYANGGGEADCPQSCDQCGLFLENTLTPDGDAWLRERCRPYQAPDDDGDVAPWPLIADRAEDDGQGALAEWIRFYFAAGM